MQGEALEPGAERLGQGRDGWLDSSRLLEARAHRSRLRLGQRIVELGVGLALGGLRLTLEEAVDPTDDGRQDPLDLALRGRRQLDEGRGLLRLEGEDAVGNEAVGVRVQIQGRARLMQEADRARHHLREAVGPGLPALEHEDGADRDADYAASELGVASEQEPQRSRHGEHPLTERHGRDHLLAQVQREVVHATRLARRAQPTLAREARVAATVLAAQRGLGQHRLEVLAHDLVQHGLVGLARAIARRRRSAGRTSVLLEDDAVRADVAHAGARQGIARAALAGSARCTGFW